MPKPAALPPEFGDRAFSVGEARAAGVTRGRLRSGDLVAPYRGVRAPSAAESLVEHCRQLAVRMPEHEYFSHLTAARLHGIPLPSRLERLPELHVSVVEPHHRPSVRGVTAHRSRVAPALIERHGIRLVAAPVAWAQLAAGRDRAEATVDDLVVAGDHLLRRRSPLAEFADLVAAAESVRAGRGGGRAARPIIRAGTDSPMESRLRLVIVAAGLPEPVIGHVIVDSTGGFIGTPDLAYVAQRIAIEYEGDIHRTDANVYAADIDRRELMEAAGWIVIRVVAHHLAHNRLSLIARIREALLSRS